MEFISAEEFLKQSIGIRKLFLDWWKCDTGDLYIKKSEYELNAQYCNVLCINIDLMVKLFSGIKESFENLCVLFGDIERNNLGSFHNPIYYNILRAIKPDESKSGDKVRLSDFYFIRK